MTKLVTWSTRLVGASLLGTTAGIHAYLWTNGYRSIPKIGNMFMALIVAASLLCLIVAAAPRRVLPLAALAGAGLELGTVVGLAISVNRSAGLFQFRESSMATLFWPSVWVEIAGTVVLGALAVAGAVTFRRSHGRAQVSASHA